MAQRRAQLDPLLELRSTAHDGPLLPPSSLNLSLPQWVAAPVLS